ncbi:MAG: exodeoxyribonuclease III [Candidatus Margulisiibacteriota bacterium]
MKLVTWNVNGIRSAVNKGFLDYLETEAPDICCVQEVKAQEVNLPDNVLNPSGYYGIWYPSERPGYSGVAVFTKIKPENIQLGMGNAKYDVEGRVIQLDYPDFTLFNVYFPNGQKDEDRLQYKLDFYQDFFDYCEDLRKSGKNIIITGDYNIAHKEIDLANPKENENYSGFLPVERAWLDNLIDLKYIDVFRNFNSEPDQYTWWTYRFGARKRNIGWRIDYFFVNQEFLSRVKDCKIRSDILGSDHCPVEMYIE